MDEMASGDRAGTGVLVVGGGVIGLWSAWQFAASGADVTVVDSREPGQASAAGGGILAPIPPTSYSAELAPLLEDSLRRYPDACAELVELTGISAEYWRSGCRLYGDSPDASQRLPVWMQGAQPHPGDSDGTTGSESLWLPNVAQIRPPRLLAALRAACLRSGCRFLSRRVQGLDLSSSAPAAVLEDGQKVIADRLVIAAGAWSGGLTDEVSTRPVSGQMLALDAAGRAPQNIVIESGRYLIPRQDGVVIVGSTLNVDSWDWQPVDQETRFLREFAEKVCPPLRHAPMLRRWCGLRPAPGNLSDIPVIRTAEHHSNVIIASGHYRLGLSLAPATAVRVVALAA